MGKIAPRASGKERRVGLVVSRFNAPVTEAMLAAALAALEKSGVASEAVTVASVPGALEIPLALQAMAQTGKFDALVALGAVIRGETYHFEIVAQQSACGVASVQLETGIAVGNGILTTDSEAQAMARAADKARDAVAAALELSNLVCDLRQWAK